MLIVNIIAAPKPKLAIVYNPVIDKITVELADVIGLIEISNPDDFNEVGTLPIYMSSDPSGVYTPPQFGVGFLDFCSVDEDIDLDKYDAQVKEIKQLYSEAASNTVEVETLGNLSKIKRPFIRHVKKDNPEDDT